MCRMWWFIAVLRSFFHSSLLYTLSFHPFSPTSLPSSFTSSCHLFLGLHRRHSSPYCCWSLWWISADRTFSPRNLITMRCSTLRGTFCSLITLATPRQDWTGSNPSRREGGGCGFTLSRSHSCCAVQLVYAQISPGHIWTTLYTGPKILLYTFLSKMFVYLCLWVYTFQMHMLKFCLLLCSLVLILVF